MASHRAGSTRYLRRPSEAHEDASERYEVFEDAKHELGKGSYGTVYLGKDRYEDRNIAAKKCVIYKEYMDDFDWKHEADMLTKKISRHQNLIQIYDLITEEFEDQGIPQIAIWMMLEYCKLGNLQIYAYNTDLSVYASLDIMLQASMGVEHLHGERVIHRDIKPQNMLVTGSKRQPIVKLSDFGDAKKVVNESSLEKGTKHPHGTENYMAPEQINFQGGKFVYKENADTYSLGLSFLTLLRARKGKMITAPKAGGQAVGKAMQKEKGNAFHLFKPSIDKSSDNRLIKSIKNVIKAMIQYEPDGRISISKVVEKLSQLKATVTQIDKFAIYGTESLGHGSLGTVYSGEHVTTKQPVAAKKLVGETPVRSAMIRNEADMLLNVVEPHENIVEAYSFKQDVGEEGSKQSMDHWLVMELCELGNLQEYATSRELTIDQKLDIMLQSAYAVCHLHDHEPAPVVHKNITPQTLLVAGTIDQPVVKLGNFKRAEVLEGTESSFSMPSCVLQPEFLAPEQTRKGDAKVTRLVYDQSVDIFMLGLNYWMLWQAEQGSAMAPPQINGQPIGEAMWETQGNAPRDLTQSPGGLDFLINVIIRDMLSFQPCDRPSARDVVKYLKALKSGMKKIDGYRVVKRKVFSFAQGTLATLYLGYQEHTKKPIAVKTFAPRVAEDVGNTESIAKMIDEEKYILLQFPPHENIMEVYNCFRDPTKSKLMMMVITEPMTSNLRKHVKKNLLSVEDKIDLMLQSAEALRHLHEHDPQSTFYRDISSDNILIDTADGQPVVKLYAFAVTRAVPSDEDDEDDGEIQWHYKAPEQCELQNGMFVSDQKTEIFNLGMTFLEIWESRGRASNGPRTLDGQSLGKAMHNAMKKWKIYLVPHVGVPVHHDCDSATAEVIKNIISYMLRYSPQDRPTAAQLVKKLSELKTPPPQTKTTGTKPPRTETAETQTTATETETTGTQTTEADTKAAATRRAEAKSARAKTAVRNALTKAAEMKTSGSKAKGMKTTGTKRP